MDLGSQLTSFYIGCYFRAHKIKRYDPRCEFSLSALSFIQGKPVRLVTRAPWWSVFADQIEHKLWSVK